LASQEPIGAPDTTFCRQCGKPIEADARFCRFCGKPQTERLAAPTTAARPVSARKGSSSKPSARIDGFEARLRQLFPRHHLQDDFMQIGSIAVFFMALIGFVLGFFPAYSWLSTNFLLGAIALALFLILRESTLSHIRARGGPDSPASSPRYQTSRPAAAPSSEASAEAATTQSSPSGQ
jgi:hypothetical protein